MKFRAPLRLATATALALALSCSPSTPDPLYGNQWHLKNTGQSGGTAGEDINVEPVWSSCKDSTCHGEGVTVCVVDGGTQISHEDLSANVGKGSYNYVNGGSDPTALATPQQVTNNADIAHGTATAGLIAARDGNPYGGRGVASRATLIAYDLLESTYASYEADAMTRGTVGVSSNSWGFPDGYGEVFASVASWQSAINTGTSSGRGGLGTIFFWAAGNGDTGSSDCPDCEDNSNYDGQANYRGVMAIGSVTDKGVKSDYSERGANLLVSAPGGEFCNNGSLHAITTADLMGSAGFNPSFSVAMGAKDYSNTNYTLCMNGTSAATPQAAGVAALILQANSKLSWRDVRIILAKTARQNDATDTGKTAFTTDTRDTPGWKTNGAGYNINHNYGFGVVDASAAVTAAKTWTPVGTQVVTSSYSSSPGTSIPDNNTTGISDTIVVSGSGVSHIEWIEITFTSDHNYCGDLDITLTNNTTGTLSRLAETHNCYDQTKSQPTCTAYTSWVFGDIRHIDEAADATWQLNVRDLVTSDTGNLNSWGLKFYGR